MITFDLDKQKTDVSTAISKIYMFFEGEEGVKLFIRESAHAGNFHIKVLGFPNSYGVRAALGDDPKRIEIDKLREKQGLPINILFSQKRYPDGEVKKAGEWRRVQ